MGVSEAKKVPTRSRIKYRPDQIEAMEESFLTHQYPDSESIEQLAEKVGVSAERVAIWFQNRRAKFKRESKSVQMNWMRKQFYTGTPEQTSSSQKSSHVISCNPTDFNVENRLQPECLPSKNIHYLPNLRQNLPDDISNSSFSSGVSSSPSPPTASMTSSPPYPLAHRHRMPEYTSTYPAFYPQYIADYHQPYFRHYAPPQSTLPVNPMHVPFTPGYQLMTLQ
ncbi:homeobox protein NOBOX-like [Saccostrea echinata]|uniref:homeobox protein NOBOX-like n=1 Tax=Saccostrea echinata TaxID=191078 RepID=UPI002A838B37|nr:homeobox protein NOBOX-like [Saccostrea echinata]